VGTVGRAFRGFSWKAELAEESVSGRGALQNRFTEAWDKPHSACPFILLVLIKNFSVQRHLIKRQHDRISVEISFEGRCVVVSTFLRISPKSNFTEEHACSLLVLPHSG